MQKLIEVKVECYSGYRAEESPRRFYINDMRFEIEAITDRWYQARSEPGFPPAHYFKVQTGDSKQYILKHEHTSNKWYLLVKGESIIMP
ncbi:MAG: hypothetical protein ACLFQA_07525 [Bacteroidales bacterium]